MIWNPDGSVAEFSGNGSRIAAAWLARARRRRAQVTIVGRGPRVPGDASATTGRSRWRVGAVEVGEIETIELEGERVELTAVSVGNPHAVVRTTRSRAELLRLGPLHRGAPAASPSARTSSSCASTARTR